MQQADRVRFLAVMNGLAKLFEREIDPVLLDAYWFALAQWELEDFEAVAGQLMRTKKFMPRPADFEDLRNGGRETVGEVWANIRRYLLYSPYGYTVAPGTPPLIAKAIAAAGGADAIARADSGKLPFLERRFSEHFEQIRGAYEIRERLPNVASDIRSLTGTPFKAIR